MYDFMDNFLWKNLLKTVWLIFERPSNDLYDELTFVSPMHEYQKKMVYGKANPIFMAGFDFLFWFEGAEKQISKTVTQTITMI